MSNFSRFKTNSYCVGGRHIVLLITEEGLSQLKELRR